MKSLIEQEQKSIKGLWEKPLFIPIYQREFVWEDEQIENAVRTIFDDMNAGIQAYMGNILLVDKNRNDKEAFEIVDGQQRMTFSFILIKSIYELISNIKENIMSTESNIDFLEDTVQSTLNKAKSLLVVEDQDDRLGENHRPRLHYASDKLNSNITSLLDGIVDGVSKPDGRLALVKMQKKLKSLLITTIMDEDQVSMKGYKLPVEERQLKVIAKKLKELFTYVTENVKYIEIKLKDEKYATEIFERMNSTSKPLTDYELFKNYIAGQLIDIKTTDVEAKITQLDELVNDEEHKLDTTSIIRGLLYLKNGRVTSSKYKFDKLKKIYKSLHNPKNMFNEVLSFLETYSNLEKLSLSKGDEDVLLPYLIIKTYNLKQLRPAFIALVIRHGYTSDVKELFMMLISIIFKRIVFNGEVANVIESLLYQTFNNGEELDTPRNIINKIKSKSIYLDALEMEITQRSFDSIKKNEFIKVLWVYSVNRDFGNILTLTNGSTSDITINFDGSQVEHILPRSWEDNWSDVVENMDELERADLIDNPGNKMPILGEYNIKASNKSFDQKKLKHYVYSSFNNIKAKDINSKESWVISTGLHFEEIDKASKWTKTEIHNRSSLLKEDFEKEINKFLEVK